MHKQNLFTGKEIKVLYYINYKKNYFKSETKKNKF